MRRGPRGRPGMREPSSSGSCDPTPPTAHGKSIYSHDCMPPPHHCMPCRRRAQPRAHTHIPSDITHQTAHITHRTSHARAHPARAHDTRTDSDPPRARSACRVTMVHTGTPSKPHAPGRRPQATHAPSPSCVRPRSDPPPARTPTAHASQLSQPPCAAATPAKPAGSDRGPSRPARRTPSNRARTARCTRRAAGAGAASGCRQSRAARLEPRPRS